MNTMFLICIAVVKILVSGVRLHVSVWTYALVHHATISNSFKSSKPLFPPGLNQDNSDFSRNKLGLCL